MNEEERKELENRLIEKRELLLKEMGVTGKNYMANLKESSGDLSAYSFHMADQASDVDSQERAFQQLTKEGRLLYHIDEALRRLYSGEEYGVCESCGDDIGIPRLSAVPHARLCIDCKSKEENDR